MRRGRGPRSSARWLSGFRSSRRLLPVSLRQVILARIREDRDNNAFADSLRQPQGRVERRPARCADEEAFLPCEATRGDLGVLRADGHHLVADVWVLLTG